MKTAVSIPDDVFSSAERFARRTRKSRSRLYSEALREYVARHSADEITEAMNKVCKAVGNAKDSFTSGAARRALERVEW
jgi:metal-responsive CopG/Arc/MetJ family transcriptional regulator